MKKALVKITDNTACAGNPVFTIEIKVIKTENLKYNMHKEYIEQTHIWPNQQFFYQDIDGKELSKHLLVDRIAQKLKLF